MQAGRYDSPPIGYQPLLAGARTSSDRKLVELGVLREVAGYSRNRHFRDAIPLLKSGGYAGNPEKDKTPAS